MKCPECVKAGLKSTVHLDGAGMMTALYCPPFYDEDGEYHHHDSNLRTQSYRCSNGHTWVEKSHPPCQCGWPTKGKYVEPMLSPVTRAAVEEGLDDARHGRFAEPPDLDADEAALEDD